MIQKPNPSSIRLEAANDNPGGTNCSEIPLTAFVTVLARAYVARTVKAEEQSA
ncbi:hypothetical protein [Actibacterium pelagium]|uniref:Uncharacterized protein n=1 Tax=Actibacterium pelagium TaxID=2029103 RepID=A0A917EPP1_9RHOB|nr:hypothetical protein [Actibacterium pelagium]GGE62957.1 hypothetical protein GCM10011517_33340 [Actibacterium pelagium]